MDVTAYHGELTRAHWDLLLEADPHFDAVLAYTPPQHGEAEVFTIGEAKEPYAMCVIVPIEGGFEIKNISTSVMMRRHGMASALIRRWIWRVNAEPILLKSAHQRPAMINAAL